MIVASDLASSRQFSDDAVTYAVSAAMALNAKPDIATHPQIANIIERMVVLSPR